MNFQGLGKIEEYKFYLDIAFSQATKKAVLARDESFSTRLLKSRAIEVEKISTIERALNNALSDIIKKFPSLNSLPEFYQELIDTMLDQIEIKKALAKVNFVVQKIKELSGKYRANIKASTQIEDINNHRREYYGRISSLVKSLNEEFIILEFARKALREFPTIKTNMPSICICGFPNVGKSTLLQKLTGSNVKISNYAFTTKQLLIGYMTIDHKKVQLIDTPGVLNRENKKNMIEYQAYLAVKYLSEFCIFVLDITDTSGFGVKDQLKLIVDLRQRFHKDFFVYISKTDIQDKQKVLDFCKEHKLSAILDVEELKEIIEKNIDI